MEPFYSHFELCSAKWKLNLQVRLKLVLIAFLSPEVHPNYVSVEISAVDDEVYNTEVHVSVHFRLKETNVLSRFKCHTVYSAKDLRSQFFNGERPRPPNIYTFTRSTIKCLRGTHWKEEIHVQQLHLNFNGWGFRIFLLITHKLHLPVTLF